MRCGAVRCGGGACPEWWCLSRDARTGRQDRTPGRFSPARDRNRNRSNNWGRESDKNPSPVPVRRRRHWALLTARCTLHAACCSLPLDIGPFIPLPTTHGPLPVAVCQYIHTYSKSSPYNPRVCSYLDTTPTPYHPIPRHTTHTHSCLPARAKIELYTCPPTGPVSPTADALAPSPRRRNFAAQHQT